MEKRHSIGNTGFWYDIEIECHHHHHQRRRSWQRQAHILPRWARYLIAGLIALGAILGFLRGCNMLHDQATKQLPTDYYKLRMGRPAISRPSHPIRFAANTPLSELPTVTADSKHEITSGGNIDERYLFVKALASGQEGAADLYIDQQDGSTVVVKTFTSIARNRIPIWFADDFANYTTTWPAEIEASLLLGTHDNKSGYVPVVDYFILKTPSDWFWALVTPFIAHGTLVNLAADERESSSSKTADQLDATYRPSLEAMLAQLRGLHDSGYCHDDVKPDNIFVQDPEHWLLGDLGNVRHAGHPWHSTRSWIRQNQWPDCKANDLRRAFKSYLWFLRRGSVDQTQFDRDFWEGSKGWSRMYWDFMHGLVTSANSKDAVNPHRAQAMLDETSADHASIVTGHIWHGNTERELLCTSIPRRLWGWSEYFGLS